MNHQVPTCMGSAKNSVNDVAAQPSATTVVAWRQRRPRRLGGGERSAQRAAKVRAATSASMAAANTSARSSPLPWKAPTRHSTSLPPRSG
jgi:hypothetical protein